MNITETISLLDELRGKATQGEYANRDNRALLVLNDDLPGGCKQIAVEVHKDDIQYIATLHNNYEALRQAALDGERYRKAGEALAEAIERMDKIGPCAPYCTGCSALAAYRQAVEQKEV